MAGRLSYDVVVKSFKPDADLTTQGGSLDDDRGDDAQSVWKFCVVYAASIGIVPSEPVIWRADDAALGLGRRSAATDGAPWLQIQDERVSREHARLSMTKAGPMVEDLKSRNGSALNGVRLKPGESRLISDRDVLRIGDSFVVVRHEPEHLTDAPIATYVGVSREARRVRCAIARTMLHERAVLILGETGTGKEVAAQAVHTWSRRSGPLVAVNCAAIPATLAEAQLFGVERGAFTGALERPGAFAEAEHGTLFLDELGELPLDVQPKLLRVLETREVLRVGGRRPQTREVRIVAATNRDLNEAIRSGAFREDLYARLASDVIQLPPLRDRPEDILLLAQKLAGAELRPSPRLVAALLAHSWPRNVRELTHIVSQLRDRSEDEVIQALAVPARAAAPPASEAPAPAASAPAVRHWQSGDPVPSRERVVELLEQHRGNLSHIEEQHGYSRRQFRRWATDHGLDPSTFRKRD